MSDEDKSPASYNWGKVIAEARQAQKLTQAELAERLYMSQSAVADWETGKTRPRASLWPRIDRMLKTNLTDHLVKETRLNTRGVRSFPRSETVLEYLDLSRVQRFRSLLTTFARALAEADISLQPLEFAGRAFMMWERVQSTGPLRTEEARLLDEVEGAVAAILQLQRGEIDTLPFSTG